MSTLKFFGQACFTIQTDVHLLIFDPYLRANPFQIALPNEIHPDYIFVTHGHADHIGDTVELCEQNPQSTLIVTPEMGRFLTAKGCKQMAPMHIGGKMQFPFGRVRVTQAIHGADIPGGIACGFIVTIDGKNIYFAGDTALFGDMKLIAELDPIDYALLPIGDRYTMGPEEAAIAADFLRAKNVIPMHYNGNPRTMQDPHRFQQLVHQRCPNANVIIMNPGDSISI